MSEWQYISARVVPGHRVASGSNGDPRFPGGTIRMQTPHFRELGLDLGIYHPGTVNVSISPFRYRVARPRHTFRTLKWHPSEAAEDFSFFDFKLVRPDGTRVDGLVYYPHPETKPEHCQQPDVLELLLPFTSGLAYGMELALEVPEEQLVILPPDDGGEATPVIGGGGP